MCDKTNCCQVAAKADALKASAQSFGLDASWVADILTKYGPETLALVVEACRQGLTASLVTEVVTTFGPGLLQVLVSYLHLKNMKKLDSSVVPGVLVPGESTGIIDVVIQQYLPVIIEKYLPVLLQQYGPQILQAILKIIQQSVTPAPAPNPTPVS